MTDAWERVQLASARVPFRVKTAAVWVVPILGLSVAILLPRHRDGRVGPEGLEPPASTV